MGGRHLGFDRTGLTACTQTQERIQDPGEISHTGGQRTGCPGPKNAMTK